MDSNSLTRYFLIGSFLFLLYLSYLIVKPFITYLIVAVLLAYAIYPLNAYLKKELRIPWLSSLIMVIFVFLIILLPSAYIGTQLFHQATYAYEFGVNFDFSSFNDRISELAGTQVDVGNYVDSIIVSIRDYFTKAIPSFFRSISDIAIGLVVMFITMYYIFRHGENILGSIKKYLPIPEMHKKRFFSELSSISSAVIDGQLLTAVVQGITGGIGFVIFGIPNAVLWGFVMIIFSLFPFGASLVWVPAGLIMLSLGNYFAGFGVLIYGALVTSNIDNLFRTYFVSVKGNISVLTTLIGLIGGSKAFGIVGLLIGPLVLSVFLGFVKVYVEMYDHNKIIASKIN